MIQTKEQWSKQVLDIHPTELLFRKLKSFFLHNLLIMIYV